MNPETVAMLQLYRNVHRMRVAEQTGRSLAALLLGDHRDRYLEPGNLHRELCTLACRWICREPAQPLLVHTCKLIFVRQDHGGAHNFVDGTPSLIEDGCNVGQALPSLLLNGGSVDLAG